MLDIDTANHKDIDAHRPAYECLGEHLTRRDSVAERAAGFEVALPSLSLVRAARASSGPPAGRAARHHALDVAPDVRSLSVDFNYRSAARGSSRSQWQALHS